MARLVLVAGAIALVALVSLPGCGGVSPAEDRPGASAKSTIAWCEAEFTASPTNGYVPVEVQFTDLSTGDVDTWQWDLDGDGFVDSTFRHPTHTYSSPGSYTVSLTVTGPGGSDVERKEACLVLATPACKADFAAVPTVVAGSGIVQFTDMSQGEISGWAWDFDSDGKSDSTKRNPTYAYVEYGVYSVTLIITALHCQDTLTKRDYIEYVSAPEAEFSAYPTHGYLPRKVQFTDLSTGDIDSWQWDLDGDGVVDSTLKDPDYTYTEPGAYRVSLKVAGPSGWDEMTKEAYLEFALYPCRADFVAQPTAGTGITRVRFTDKSKGDIDSWAWDFDSDGVVDSTDQNPIYDYRRNGLYSVTLTVRGPYCEREDTLTKSDYIEVTGCYT